MGEVESRESILAECPEADRRRCLLDLQVYGCFFVERDKHLGTVSRISPLEAYKYIEKLQLAK